MIQIAVPATGEEEWLATREAFDSGWLTQGPRVKEFEVAFAARHKVDHALAVTSCTTGLHLALAALGVGPGDEVVVPAFTWVATANVVLYTGATPVFADVDLATYNIDPLKIKLNNATKAIIPVHLFGQCADMDALPSVLTIEDAACAAGAAYNGRPAGSLGDVGVFSFHPRKIITTGEGGMVTTNDSTLAAQMERLRNHGASVSEEQRHHGPHPYLLPDFDVMGFNYRMTDLQGAVGTVQLGKLDRFLVERAEQAALYETAFADLDWLVTPQVGADYKHSWQAYVTRVTDDAPMARNELMDKLFERGISTRPGTHAVPLLGYFRERYGFTDSDFPNAALCERQTLALPLHNCLSNDDQRRVIDEVYQLTSNLAVI